MTICRRLPSTRILAAEEEGGGRPASLEEALGQEAQEVPEGLVGRNLLSLGRAGEGLGGRRWTGTSASSSPLGGRVLVVGGGGDRRQGRRTSITG